MEVLWHRESFMLSLVASVRLFRCSLLTIFSSVSQAYQQIMRTDSPAVVHERGNKLGYYTVCLCWGSTGPLYAGYMLAGGYSWRLYFYVEIAFAGLLLILAFLFVEETTYKRKMPTGPPSDASSGDRKVFSQDEVEEKEVPSEHVEVQTLIPPRRSFIATLKPWSAINHDESFFTTMVRALLQTGDFSHLLTF